MDEIPEELRHFFETSPDDKRDIAGTFDTVLKNLIDIGEVPLNNGYLTLQAAIGQQELADILDHTSRTSGLDYTRIWDILCDYSVNKDILWKNK